MSNKICLLVSLLCGDELLKCAIKLDRDLLEDEFYMEDYNRKILFDLLPSHCNYPIVEVIEIFEITEVCDEK